MEKAQSNQKMAAPKSTMSEAPDRPRFEGTVGIDRTEVVRRFRFSLTGTIILAILAVYGVFLDESIQSDPFSQSLSTWDWFSNSQPHPALARIPVVPVGSRGVLTFRPLDTTWINTPIFPDAEDPETAEKVSHLQLFPPALASVSTEETTDVLQLREHRQEIEIAQSANQSQTGVPVTGGNSDGDQRETQISPSDPTLYRPALGNVPESLRASPLVLDAEISPDGRTIWIVGTHEFIMHSEDGGASWKERKLDLEGISSDISEIISRYKRPFDITSIYPFRDRFEKFITYDDLNSMFVSFGSIPKAYP